MLRHRLNLRQISIEMERVAMLLPPANENHVMILLAREAPRADQQASYLTSTWSSSLASRTKNPTPTNLGLTSTTKRAGLCIRQTAACTGLQSMSVWSGTRSLPHRMISTGSSTKVLATVSLVAVTGRLSITHSALPVRKLNVKQCTSSSNAELHTKRGCVP